jgi:hypothetical protein
MTFETAKELLGQNDRWEHLDEAELVQLVSVGSWLAALEDDEAREERFESLYAHAVENLELRPEPRRSGMVPRIRRDSNTDRRLSVLKGALGPGASQPEVSGMAK